MRTIKMVGRNRIFSPLCLIKAVDNKRKNAINHECVTVYNKELTAVFISFYQALLIIMRIQVVY